MTKEQYDRIRPALRRLRKEHDQLKQQLDLALLTRSQYWTLLKGIQRRKLNLLNCTQ